MVFSRSGLWFFSVWGFCVPIGLVWLCNTRSVRSYSSHPPPPLFCYAGVLPAPALPLFFALRSATVCQ